VYINGNRIRGVFQIKYEHHKMKKILSYEWIRKVTYDILAKSAMLIHISSNNIR
jgi:hypothetical protein